MIKSTNERGTLKGEEKNFSQKPKARDIKNIYSMVKKYTY